MSQTGEAQVPLLQTEEADVEWSSKPRRIALFVEPSPFALVSAFSSQAFGCWSD
jgi:sulfoquinovosyltransferase